MADGVTEYTEAWVQLFFPDDEVCCQYCPLMTEDAIRRKVCFKTGLFIKNIKARLDGCPLQIIDKEEQLDGA